MFFRTIFVLMLLLLCVSGYAQYKLSGKLRYCEDKYPVSKHKIRLFKEDAQVAIVKTDEKGRFIFDKLTDGDYEIHYKSSYQRDIAIQQRIKGKNIRKIKLCYDSLDVDLDTIKTPVDELALNDSIQIACNSVGCFHRTFEKITLRKIHDSDYVCNYYYQDSLVAEIVKHDLNGLRDFLIQGTLVTYTGNHGCTTVDHYTILINQDLFRPTFIGYKMLPHSDIDQLSFPISFYDGTCTWNGFNELKNALFE